MRAFYLLCAALAAGCNLDGLNQPVTCPDFATSSVGDLAMPATPDMAAAKDMARATDLNCDRVELVNVVCGDAMSGQSCTTFNLERACKNAGACMHDQEELFTGTVTNIANDVDGLPVSWTIDDQSFRSPRYCRRVRASKKWVYDMCGANDECFSGVCTHINGGNIQTCGCATDQDCTVYYGPAMVCNKQTHACVWR